MKRIFLILFICVMLIAVPAWAGVDNKTIIDAVQLDDDPTSVTSAVWNIQDYNEVGFWVEYDETEVGNAISASVTLDISYDGTTWLDMPFYDIAGTTTIQTSETISADGWYYCALPTTYYPIGTMLLVRMVIAATNTDADDILVVSAYLTGTR